MKPSIPSSNTTCSSSSHRITSYEHIVEEGRNCSTNFCFRAIPLTICLCPLPLIRTSAQHHSSETLLRDAPSDRSKRIHRNIPGNRTFLFFLTPLFATRNHYVRSIVNMSQFPEDRTRKIMEYLWKCNFVSDYDSPWRHSLLTVWKFTTWDFR